MLLTDFKAIADIDSQISELHKQLQGLYGVRADYLDAKNPAVIQKRGNHNIFGYSSISPLQNWPNKEYNRLKFIWQSYAIEVPSYSSLKNKLQKAHQLIIKLSSSSSPLTSNLTVMLVPPAKMFNMQIYSQLLEANYPSSAPFYIDQELPAINKSSTWRIFVVYNAPTGLSLGSAKKMFDQKSYMFDKYDMRGLGVVEYAAFTLQNDFVADVNSWTLLLKNYKQKPGQQVPSAAYAGNHYRFELDDESGLFDDEHFRPAVEIK